MSGDRDGSQVSQVGIKVERKVRSRLVSIVIKVDQSCPSQLKLIFELRNTI